VKVEPRCERVFSVESALEILDDSPNRLRITAWIRRRIPHSRLRLTSTTDS
jgi:hypothetical protein